MYPRLLHIHSPALSRMKLALIKSIDQARYGPPKQLSYDEIVAKLDKHHDHDEVLEDPSSPQRQAEDA